MDKGEKDTEDYLQANKEKKIWSLSQEYWFTHTGNFGSRNKMRKAALDRTYSLIIGTF